MRLHYSIFCSNRRALRQFITLTAVTVLVTLGIGCATTGTSGSKSKSRGFFSRSYFKTEGGFSLKNAKPKPLSLMVAQRIDRPLYMVLDPDRVRNTIHMETPACATQQPGCEEFSIFDVQTFVTRDLKAAMGNFFTKVEVVDSPQKIPPEPHVVADVKIDDIRLRLDQRGSLLFVFTEMTWGFAIRPSDKSDYSYSWAGTTISSDGSFSTYEAILASLIENSIPAMLKKWVEEGGMDSLRSPKN